MFNASTLKAIFALVLLVSTGGVIYQWHYKPLKQKDSQIVSLERELSIVGASLNVCEANLTKQVLQGYIDGIGAIDENVTTTLDNLHT